MTKEDFEKFLDMINNQRLSIPLLEVLLKMPNYAKFMKEILSNKRKLGDATSAIVVEELRAMVFNEEVEDQAPNENLSLYLNTLHKR